MTLPGSSGVSASGAATYNIPIAIPQGTAGMSPALSLDYNSQGGNGLLGMGWSLSGLSAIGRCARTQAQDNFRGAVNYDTIDAFCLDGQRMVRLGGGAYGADGAEYRTEIDSFSKIIAHGTAGTGPAWFEVRTKAGQVMEFGNTTDSRVLAQGKPTARSWALNKLSDTKGNYLTVSYVNDNANGQVYPSRIDYTGNAAAGVAPFNQVQFIYAARPDVTPAYHAGSLMQTTVRLTNVKTYAAGGLVSDYRLAYQQSPTSNRSEVTSITVCGSDGACLPATALQWVSSGSTPFTVFEVPGNGWTFGSPPTGNYTPIFGDFNGDGRSDFLLMNADSKLHVFMSKGDGTFANSEVPNGWGFGAPPAASYTPITGDFNGDGKTDFLMLGANSKLHVFMSKGDGTFALSEQLNGWGFGSPPNANFVPITGDFRGDGRTSFLLMDGNSKLHVFMSNGDGTFSTSEVPNGWGFGMPPTANYTPITGDFNGDGKTDFLMMGANSKLHVFLSRGDGTFGVSEQPNGWGFGSPPDANYLPVTGDFNGDGKTDFLMMGSNSKLHIFMSRGDGTFSVSEQLNGWGFGTPPNANFVPVIGDFNGDGRTDFLLMDSNSKLHVFMSKGDGTFGIFEQPYGWGFGSPPSAEYLPVSGDFNGDGKTDFLMMSSVAKLHLFLTNGSVNDVVASISTGLGASSAFAYAPLTSGSVYSKDSTATYPVQDIQAPMYVVSRVDGPNGVGGTYSSSYSYAGAKADLSGRGFLGFRQMTSKDLQTSIVQTTAYRQDFPFVGMAASSTRAIGTLTLSQATNGYQFSNASGGAAAAAGNAPYRVSLSQNVTSARDLDGSALPSVTTSYQYDAYGNATQIVASTSDGFSKTTSNAYSNDVTQWLLGRLTRASVTSVAP